MSDMTNCIRLFSFVLCLIILISILPGCTNDSDSKKEVETVNATIDEATSQPTEETIQLLLEEQEYPSVKLNSNFDWESLYYEYLRSLDNTKYSGCALIYINDDDVPELYIKSQSLDKSDMICFVTENGLFVSRINISDSKGFWYLEKQGKLLVVNEKTGQFTESDDTTSATEVHNEINRDADLYSFTGNSLESTYRFGRYVVDGKVFDTDVMDDGAYDYYDGEKDVPVYDVFTAIKGYFDVEKASMPNVVSMDSIVESLKGERKNPDVTAGEYNGDPYSLVSTYEDVSRTVDHYDETVTISYRIPQIELDGEDIKAINQEILDEFADDANSIENLSDENDSITRYKTVDYNVYSENGVLSLVIDGKGWGGTSSPDNRLIYTIGIPSEKRISNLCLFNSYGVDCQKVANAFDKQIKADYDAIKNDPEHPINHPDSGFDENTCDDLYKGTMEQFSPVGEYNKMYFDDDGNLNILYQYKWIAGSSYYQKTMVIDRSDII